VTRPLIAVTDSVFPSLDPAMAALKQLDPEIRIAKSTSEADILDVARDADGVLVTYAKLPGELLRQLQRCKVIGRFGLGVDNIDIKAAVALSCRFAGSKARFWVSSALAISRGVSCRRRRRSASR